MIIENCFLDSADYSRYLNSDEKLRTIARADAAGIADYYGLKRYDYKHHWSKPYVEHALEKGWVAGYDEFAQRTPLAEQTFKSRQERENEALIAEKEEQRNNSFWVKIFRKLHLFGF